MMSATVARRAGSVVSRASATTTNSSVAHFSSHYGKEDRKALEELRAVSPEEAPGIKPPKETSTEAMVPWRGWIERSLKSKMPPQTFDAVKGFFYFWPEDPNNLNQLPYANDQHVVDKDGKTSVAMREVSPGSQPFVDIPKHDLEDDPYDSGYFKKDTRRRYVDPEFPNPEVEQLKLDMLDPNDPEVIEAKKRLAAGPLSSPGNGGVFANGVSETQMGGLRAVMSVTNEDLFAELDKHMPDHLPTPTWAADDEEAKKLFQWYKDRGLPVPIGGNFNGVSTKRRIAKW
eukprot:CAMPEP_0116141472 /NCGR_PEP_ID=MMETSP0329-20121206/14400_1 /TAXON_ID=697910 /ORGANISM="Pseudo-nitzschia arenysensis, Strain B593" /LENGTH=286 /DNA_ID=CAMNT_0003636657 /DNA_START=146 /DNA_END=1006 /DNA_ORIENTATION=+